MKRVALQPAPDQGGGAKIRGYDANSMRIPIAFIGGNEHVRHHYAQIGA